MLIPKPKVTYIHQTIPILPLIVKGQGVFVFENKDNTKACSFCFFDSTCTKGLLIEFHQTLVHVVMIPTHETLIDTHNTKGLTDKNGAYYWFSLDCQNQVLYAGVGEARLENCIYTYKFPSKDSKDSKAFLDALNTVYICAESVALAPIKLLRDPVTVQVPLRIKNTDTLIMTDIATGRFLPHANLSIMSQKLYNCVSGTQFVLDDEDFPFFSKAIERSIASPMGWCNKRLKEKQNEFSKDTPDPKETYLRITLGQNNGESPGIPYVMEIWPIGHYSPIHNHAGANAIIRVLHGTISVNLYPYLCAEKHGVDPCATAEFTTGEITWLSQGLNQIHKLTNLPSNTQTCITIQCYMYDEENKSHYEYFDYIDASGDKQQYEPDSDMDFVDFKAIMKKEWAEEF